MHLMIQLYKEYVLTALSSIFSCEKLVSSEATKDFANHLKWQ